jgi:undecaprenyl-diphosphatase
MPIYQAVILAIVQAVTEFLPISSTAHLFLFPWLLDWGDPGIPFTVAVHAGTLVAVVLYFLRDWLRLTLCGFGMHYPRAAPAEDVVQSRRIFWYLVAGTIPAGIAGLLLEDLIATTFRSPYLMGSMLILVGILMWWAERESRLTRSIEQLSLGDAITVGTAQAIALVPGVSRSGITIIAGIWRGMSRESAARFTFLLSTPIIAGAAAKTVFDLRHTPPPSDALAAMLVGFVISAVFGYGVIAFLLRYLQTRTLRIFIVYRVVFGIVILSLAFLHGGSAR